MTARRGVLTGGTWCADHNKVVEVWPGENCVTEILGHDVRGGGSACNLAIDLKRLDPAMPVETIAVIGDDEDGRILLAEARDAGIVHRQMRILPGVKTAFTDAFTIRGTGQRTHLTLQGASAHLSPDHFDFQGGSARFFHLGLPGVHARMDAPWGDDPNGWVTVLRTARATGLETNLELCSIGAQRLHDLVRPCLAHLDLLIVNDFEIAAIAGTPVSALAETDLDAVTRAARAVMDAGAMALVVVHFPAGAILLARDAEPVFAPSVALAPEDIVGANGAGDAFAAGMLHGLDQGWDLSACARLGHAAASQSLRSLGTTDGVGTVRTCLAAADRTGWRS